MAGVSNQVEYAGEKTIAQAWALLQRSVGCAPWCEGGPPNPYLLSPAL